jgi:hypothetical protein
MCCCGKPTINGQPGYKWQPNDPPMIRPAYPPELGEHDTLIYDEPGRCGGLDAHCHHYRIVKEFGSLYLLVRHGGGEERFRLHDTPNLTATLASLDTNARYWLLHAIYYSHSDGERDAQAKTAEEFRRAFVDGRLKKRKVRGQNCYKVTIESEAMRKLRKECRA